MLYTFLLFLHYLSFLSWVGGSLFLWEIFLILHRKKEKEILPYIYRSSLFISWGSFLSLLITGAILWGFFYGQSKEVFFLKKIIGGSILLLLKILHDFFLTKKAKKEKGKWILITRIGAFLLLLGGVLLGFFSIRR